MRRMLVLGSCATVVLSAAACQDATTAPAASAGRAPLAARTALAGARVDAGRPALPLAERMTDRNLGAAARRAINPDDYVCSASSPVSDWFGAKAAEVIRREPATFDLVYNDLAGSIVPTYDAYVFQTSATPQYFGYSGEYTKVLQKTDRDVKRFWDIASADIQLVGLHGSMLTDSARVALNYRVVFGVPANLAAVYAGIMRNAVLQSKTLNGGNHPLFSFNAFAIAGFDLPGVGAIPDKIVMGDGILEGYRAVGLDDVAPQAIYAHEFGHHIQFERGYFEDPIATAGDAPEQTRYTELMADAYSAYYLTHKRGGTLNRKRVEQFFEVFFQIGDCQFQSEGHHGTPNQRMAAARFGFDVADQAQKQGHILTADQFHALFVAKYPELVKPDAA